MYQLSTCSSEDLKAICNMYKMCGVCLSNIKETPNSWQRLGHWKVTFYYSFERPTHAKCQEGLGNIKNQSFTTGSHVRQAWVLYYNSFGLPTRTTRVQGCVPSCPSEPAPTKKTVLRTVFCSCVLLLSFLRGLPQSFKLAILSSRCDLSVVAGGKFFEG